MSMDEARTEEERTNIKTLFGKALVYTLGISVVYGLAVYFLCQNDKAMAAFPSLFVNGVIVIYFLTIFALFFKAYPSRQRYLARVLATEHAGNYPPAAYEYRSNATLLGMPLLHVRIGDRFDDARGPLKAWIAIGSSNAVGMIFASGGVATAPIAFGGIAIGFVSFGAISFGLLSLGACAVGGLAYGGLAIGWQAFGALAFGWKAAMGVLAAAFDFASGGIAWGAQANNDAARQFIAQNWFFQIAQTWLKHGILVLLIWIVPTALQARIVARARRREESHNS
jgi:hypothetical protein